jgi:hypothetical protein
MPFAPITMPECVALHLRSNPTENADDLTSRLRAALAARLAGDTSERGNALWVIGSAVAGHACFTCITGEAVPEADYEIAEALGAD